MKSQYLLVLALFFALLGCANKPQVHLYAKYLTKQDKQIVSQQIEDLGFTAILNTLDFPMSINDHTIIYSLLLENTENIDLLVNGMHSIGINIVTIEPMVSGNHWYTKNSLALLLNNRDSKATQDLAATYKSADCDSLFELILRKDGSYQLAGKLWTDEQQPLSRGKWKLRQHPYLELRPEKGERWYRYYEITQSIEEDKIGKVDVIKLNSLDTHQLVGECSFVIGIRR